LRITSIENRTKEQSPTPIKATGKTGSSSSVEERGRPKSEGQNERQESMRGKRGGPHFKTPPWGREEDQHEKTILRQLEGSSKKKRGGQRLGRGGGSLARFLGHRGKNPESKELATAPGRGDVGGGRRREKNRLSLMARGRCGRFFGRRRHQGEGKRITHQNERTREAKRPRRGRGPPRKSL